MGQLWSCCARCSMLAMALLFFAVAPLGNALAAQANRHGLSGWFFRFTIWSCLPSVLYGHAGLGIYLLGLPAAAGLPWSFYWPLAVARLANWGWLVAQAPELPVGPRFCCLVLVVCCSSPPPATKLAWLHTAAGACRIAADSACIGILARVNRQGPLP